MNLFVDKMVVAIVLMNLFVNKMVSLKQFFAELYILIRLFTIYEKWLLES